ncbi:hypothetical protein Dip510_001129 [Elusimicrobium posterum]|uniref:hypothetical protein n=1 Tax=Elusimicrobium posterum TaxID=3116653 RepID=UPI003C7823AB
MEKKYIFIWLGLFLVLAASWAISRPYNLDITSDKAYACSKDEDCVVVSPYCYSFSSIAINKKYLKAFEKNMNCPPPKPVNLQVPSMKPSVRHMPKCAENKCFLETKIYGAD